MAILSERKQPRIKLYGKKHPDGTFDAAVLEDGRPVAHSDFIKLKVDIKAVQELWKRARDCWQVNPEVEDGLRECFPVEFLAAESI